jgi:hypothetical protein
VAKNITSFRHIILYFYFLFQLYSKNTPKSRCHHHRDGVPRYSTLPFYTPVSGYRAHPNHRQDDDSDLEETEQQGRGASDESDEDGEEPGDEMDTGGRLNFGSGVEEQLVKKLIWYSFACEFSRTPIRREGIRDKGMFSAGLGGTLLLYFLFSVV